MIRPAGRSRFTATLAGGHEIRTTSLPIRDARELLYAAHALEVGAAGWEGMGLRFEVLETERRATTERRGRGAVGSRIVGHGRRVARPRFGAPRLQATSLQVE